MYPGTSKAQSIHINPVFKNEVLKKIRKNCEEPPPAPKVAPLPNSAHINPRFINTNKPKTIFMNPEFLQANFKQQQQKSDVCEETAAAVAAATTAIESKKQQLPKVTQLNKIISKSRTRIVREHAKQQPTALRVGAAKPASPILLLTKRKLVRATTAAATAGAAAKTANAPTTPSRPISRRVLRFKLDNKLYSLKRTPGAVVKRRPATSFVARYALRRSGDLTKRVLRKTTTTAGLSLTDAATLNKRLRLININGILYRSSKNKLQRRVAAQVNESTTKSVNKTTPSTTTGAKIAVATKPPKGRTVYVRGTKFVLDPKGFKLTRVNAATTPNTTNLSTARDVRKTLPLTATNSRRIDIGGHTYVASSSNVFVRTSTHLVLAHLNQAKQRSVSVLSRCLRKVNKPCAIFQRLGKCAAYERNRCSKIHDKLQVVVCPKFLQGLCTNSPCLLSHNKSYQKMPVCKFFLQGCCVRHDCPYLHKKLSEGSEVCEDFRRGFCVLGEKCNKQHIFPEAKSKLLAKATAAAEADESKPQPLVPMDYDTENQNSTSPIEENALTARYFNDDSFILGLNKMDAAADDAAAVHNKMDPGTLTNGKKLVEDDSDNADDDDDDAESGGDATAEKRKPLGSLPAFIPLS